MRVANRICSAGFLVSLGDMQQFMRSCLLLASLVVFLAGPCVGSGVYGLDSAGVDIYIDGWECLAESAEIQFGIVRVRCKTKLP